MQYLFVQAYVQRQNFNYELQNLLYLFTLSNVLIETKTMTMTFFSMGCKKHQIAQIKLNNTHFMNLDLKSFFFLFFFLKSFLMEDV